MHIRFISHRTLILIKGDILLLNIGLTDLKEIGYNFISPSICVATQYFYNMTNKNLKIKDEKSMKMSHSVWFLI